MENHNDSERLQSYLWVRRAVGLIGILLPFLLIGGDSVSTDFLGIRPSISDYYYTIMGNLFVGALCAISLFMFTYKGYNEPVLKKNGKYGQRFLSDNAITNIAAIAALGIAFFPCHGNDRNPMLRVLVWQGVIPIIHYASAAIFFIALASMSIWSFTQSDGQVEKGTQKYKRNNVYKACGIIIFLSIATIGILGIIKARKPGKETTASHTCCNTICGNYDEKMVSPASDSCQLYATCYKELLGTLLNKPDEEEDYYTFLFETISLFAFGFSWFVKGETLWKDKGN